MDTAALPQPAPADAIPERALREALGRFATGVTIVTCRDAAGAPVGLTVNSFNALSLEPPLVLWSLRTSSAQLAAFAQATHFGVNVLAEDQIALSRRFATSQRPPGDDRFAHGAWREGEGGVPVLEGCAAALECALATQQDAGDHRLFIGRVLALAQAPRPPLVYQAGHYHALGDKL